MGYITEYTMGYIWLVVSAPLKNMGSSVGITIPNTWKKKKMFQATNEFYSLSYPNNMQ